MQIKVRVVAAAFAIHNVAIFTKTNPFVVERGILSGADCLGVLFQQGEKIFVDAFFCDPFFRRMYSCDEFFRIDRLGDIAGGMVFKGFNRIMTIAVTKITSKETGSNFFNRSNPFRCGISTSKKLIAVSFPRSAPILFWHRSLLLHNFNLRAMGCPSAES
jgi:hypothetical protein